MSAPSDCMRASPAIMVQGPSSDLGRKDEEVDREGGEEIELVGRRWG
jgi:hypothetical protein